MNLPIFSTTEDPGPDFARLAEQAGLVAQPTGDGDVLDLPHGTTCVALRYADGVIIAGDRRATSGNLISYRTMQKVFPSCLLYTSPSPRDGLLSRMPSSA